MSPFFILLINWRKDEKGIFINVEFGDDFATDSSAIRYGFIERY